MTRKLLTVDMGLSPRVRGNRMALIDYADDGLSPRVRGNRATWPLCPGLSPRVRGNPVQSFHTKPPSGSIPACAGEPASTTMPANLSPRRVYPRVCGGTTSLARSIPACAGEPRQRCSFYGLSRAMHGVARVYPRVCGGTTSRHRSIPACAGEPVHGQCCCLLAVYPRVCGGTAETLRHVNYMQGLSPRVRGNQHDGNPPRVRGNLEFHWTLSHYERDAAHRRVYPRVCGGTNKDGGGLSRVRGNQQRTTLGLSPRVRGNPLP